ncbi:hypothetical protein ACGF07_04980 [Kitasatospora sp. NPDC048194]|uniref:hypothetical protein n=1 Tax=Kitasatospora sp. NPDC048194 TaxID=3364045 RepID=UPI00371CBE7D
MPSRLRPALAATTAVFVLAACPLLTAGQSATAAPAPTRAAAVASQGLPPIGAEVPSSMLAIDTPMRIGNQLVRVDFRGGIKQRVDVNPDDPINSVRLRTVGFRVSAELPDGGTITFEQNDVDADAQSTLRLTQRFPPRYEERDVIPFAVTIDQPGQEPVTLMSKEPMVLIGQLTQYPARGDLYRLEKPVDLVSPENPDNVVAVLEKFPAKRGGL